MFGGMMPGTLLTDEKSIHRSRRRFPVALRRQAMFGFFKPQ
jgi:hypothetical protein